MEKPGGALKYNHTQWRSPNGAIPMAQPQSLPAYLPVDPLTMSHQGERQLLSRYSHQQDSTRELSNQGILSSP